VQERDLALICDQGNAPAQNSPAVAANTIVSDLHIRGPFDEGIAVATTTVGMSSGCNARLTNLDISGVRVGVSAVGCGLPLSAGEVPVALQLEDSSVEDLTHPGSQPEFGVLVLSCVHSATLKTSNFRRAEVGVRIQERALQDTTLGGQFSLTGNSFESLSVAGAQLYDHSVSSLVDNVFQDISAATDASAPAIALDLSNTNAAQIMFPHVVRAHNNLFLGNDVAVRLRCAFGINSNPGQPFVNFGDPSAAGANPFRCNAARAGAAFAGGDLVVDSPGGSLLPFAGNRWDHAPPTEQVSDPGGNGLDVRRRTAAAPFLNLSGATLSPVPCPAGRAPGP